MQAGCGTQQLELRNNGDPASLPRQIPPAPPKDKVMKSLRILLPLFFIATSAFAQSPKSFDLMKSLTGTWEGKTSDGRQAKEVYRLASNGSVVMSEMPGHDNMISMYHVDGSRLLMTHYCSMGNQPRMSATLASDGKSLDFEF